MEPNTHLGIDRTLCGEPRQLSEGVANVVLRTSERMAADDRGLVHGGFVFGAADYAAMLAINDPHVVLGSADVRFVRPIQVGDVVHVLATVERVDRRKRSVSVVASVDGTTVLSGTLTCFVLDRHVLD